MKWVMHWTVDMLIAFLVIGMGGCIAMIAYGLFIK